MGKEPLFRGVIANALKRVRCLDGDRPEFRDLRMVHGTGVIIWAVIMVSLFSAVLFRKDRLGLALGIAPCGL